MNYTITQPSILARQPALSQLGHNLPRTIVYLLIPTELLYFAIYFHLKGYSRLFKCLSIASAVTLLLSKVFATTNSSVVECLQNFAITLGIFKTLDLFARRHNLATSTSSQRKPEYLRAITLLADLNFAALLPQHTRNDREKHMSRQLTSAPLIALFMLQSLPRLFPYMLALELLWGVYCIAQ